MLPTDQDAYGPLVAVLSAYLMQFEPVEEAGEGVMLKTTEQIESEKFDRIEGIDGCIAFFESKHDTHTVKLAKQFRDEVCATTVLRAWKHKMIAQVPCKYRMSLLKAVYLTVKDSVRHGGFSFIVDRIKKFLNANE